MKVIISTNKKNIMVDDEDFGFLSQWNWHVSKDGYAVRNGKKSDGDMYRKSIFIHRVLMGNPVGMLVDHKDGNPSNNTKDNLRVCNHLENGANRKAMSGKKTKGVIKRSGGYESSIRINGKYIYIGLFSKKDYALNAYNYYAKEYCGEFARINDVKFIEKEEWEKHMIQNISKYTGVTQSGDKWMSRITNNKTGKREYLGTYDSEIMAARAFNNRAIELYGNNYKRLNAIEGELV